MTQSGTRIPTYILSILFLTTGFAALAADTSVIDRETVSTWLTEFSVPAVGIGIIHDSTLSECRVFGELRQGVPADRSALFRIASLTKPITSTVALKLVGTGQLDLDDPLFRYWVDPDIQDDSRLKLLTTRHVLNHQTGFPNWRETTSSKKLSFQFNPGTKYEYSGEGFEYLRRALERKFDRVLEELADALLFTPLEMTDTRYRWVNGIDTSRFAVRHDKDGNPYEENQQAEANAAAGVLTTVEDYCRFGIHVMNGAGLPSELYGEMIQPYRNLKEDVDQGLGWEIVQNLESDEYALVHEGGSKGVKTIVVLLPKSKRGIVVFTNGDQGDRVYERVLRESVEYGGVIVDLLGKMSYDPDQINTVNIQNEILQEYCGSYLIESFQMTVEIIQEEEKLKMVTPHNRIGLEAESETELFSRDDDLRIEFVRAEDGNIAGFLMTFRGGDPELVQKTE